MSNEKFQLENAPIVEAVVDIDCDLPPSFDIAALLKEEAFKQFENHYPKKRLQYLEEHNIEHTRSEPPKVSAKERINALQFLQDDEKQLIQVRSQGFSFNRLAPYTSLDDYFPKIEWAWSRYSKITSPIQIRTIRLRYINRILIPLFDNKVQLTDYFAISPRLPDEDKLVLTRFFDQHAALEPKTGHNAKIVLMGQPAVDDKIPIIFDITATATVNDVIKEWNDILDKLQSLRDLKNRIFKNTLTEKCLQLFQSH